MPRSIIEDWNDDQQLEMIVVMDEESTRLASGQSVDTRVYVCMHDVFDFAHLPSDVQQA